MKRFDVSFFSCIIFREYRNVTSTKDGHPVYLNCKAERDSSESV